MVVVSIFNVTVTSVVVVGYLFIIMGHYEFTEINNYFLSFYKESSDNAIY